MRSARLDRSLALAGRRAHELSHRLMDWQERYRALPTEENASLADEIEAFSTRIAVLIAAMDETPAIGVVGVRQAATHPVVDALLGAVRPRLATTSSVLLELTGGARSATSAASAAGILRYRRNQASTVPANLPIHLRLLDLRDLVEILARAHLGELEPARPSTVTPAHVLACLDEATTHIMPSSIDGLGRPEVVKMREVLCSAFPRSAYLGMLAACEYWDRLGEIASHLRPDRRTALLSLLWGQDPQLTQLFTTLSVALERLSRFTDLYCPIEAIALRDTQTGWLRQHPSSAFSAATINELADGTGEPIKVVNGAGAEERVGRAILAAVAAELVIDVKADAGTGGAVDILEFPAAAIPRPTLVPGTVARPGGMGKVASDVLELYQACKLEHLLHRSCRRHQLSGLVVATRFPAESDESSAPILAEWIDETHGDTAQARTRQRNALAVVVVQRAAEGERRSEAVPPDEDVHRAVLMDVLSGRRDWIEEWTPGRPFSNVYVIAADDRPAHGERIRDATTLDPAAASVGFRLRRLTAAPSSGLLAGPARLEKGWESGADEGILDADTARNLKRQQISARVVQLQRNLRGRLLRHYGAGSSDNIEWRRQVSQAVAYCLHQCADRHVLGPIQQALMIDENELRAVEQRVEHALGSADATVVDRAFADAAVSQWLRDMRQLARSGQLARALELPASALPSLVDEIAITVGRSQLARAIGHMLAGLRSRADPLVGAAVRSDRAGVAWMMIARHLESLRAVGPLKGAPSDSARTAPPGSAAERWCAAFEHMVDENLAAEGVGITTRSRRELGELLEELAADPFRFAS